MFRHKGKGRTYLHNLKLAAILSTVAGIVNITGVIHLKTLTTNVTGHFAFFAEELVLKDYQMAFIYLLYILFFLFGAFVSSVMMELMAKYRPHSSHITPVFLEIALLLLVAFSATIFPVNYSFLPIVLSFILLFSMGLQNALVTRVSQSVVRTTHLTGLFTDLGIELSQLMFSKTKLEKKRLNKSLFLKFLIIGCFFLGCIVGGYIYLRFELKTLLLPIGLLFFALWFNRLSSRYYHLKRRFRDYR